METIINFFTTLISLVFDIIPADILAGIGALAVLYLVFKFAQRIFAKILTTIILMFLFFLYRQGYFDSILTTLENDLASKLPF